MATITLKDIPPALHSALKHRAKQNGRSLNKEALACLESVVHPSKVDVTSMLAELQAHRANLPGRLNDELLEESRT
ncbi:MAG: plasmid stability protein [Verrucomicrobiota bacterium]